MLNKKSLDEKILFKWQKDYENISSLSDETIDSLSTAFKFLNHSDRQDLINLMADSQIIYIQKAVENFESNNVEKSLEYINKAIPYCKTEYAWILKSESHLSLKQYDEVIMCCDNAIKIHPECIVAWYHKAQSYMMLSRYNLSLECGDKILEINDNDYRGWIVKSISYSKQMGKHKESQKCYQKALEVCPNEEVKEEIIAIKKIYKL